MAVLGTSERPLRVAIVGSGPSGFYAAAHLLKDPSRVVKIDMIDRLPTPYGLVRGGVAPDHFRIKAVIGKYERTAEAPGFRFLGNVKVGSDITVDDLSHRYHAVLWAVGNEGDRRLGIPGEELPGVYSATEFVGWYNGHPDYRARSFALAAARRVGVVGNGNVSMDVTRVLAQPSGALGATDIADHALEELTDSGVQEIAVWGRRGVAQAAFSPKELQEIAKCEGVALDLPMNEAAVDPVSAEWLARDSDPGTKKLLEVVQGLAGRSVEGARRVVRLRFGVSPVAALGDGRLEAVRLVRNALVLRDGQVAAQATSETWEEPCDLLFRAVGYRGIPIPGLPFDERRSVVANRDGRVVDVAGAPVRGHYVVGWAKRGPTGLIGTNGPDSVATVELLLSDLDHLVEPGNNSDLDAVLRQRGHQVVSFADWKRLDDEEVRRGELRGKTRLKFTDVPSMLEFLGGSR